jgi:hypothetical protein
VARVTGHGPHGHLYEQDDTGVVVASWRPGDRPWEPGANPVADERAHVVPGERTDCPDPGSHPPVELR